MVRQGVRRLLDNGSGEGKARVQVGVRQGFRRGLGDC